MTTPIDTFLTSNNSYASSVAKHNMTPKVLLKVFGLFFPKHSKLKPQTETTFKLSLEYSKWGPHLCWFHIWSWLPIWSLFLLRSWLHTRNLGSSLLHLIERINLYLCVFWHHVILRRKKKLVMLQWWKNSSPLSSRTSRQFSSIFRRKEKKEIKFFNIRLLLFC